MKNDRSEQDGLAQRIGASIAAWPLRRKLALALAVPLIVALVLGNIRVGESLRESKNTNDAAKRVLILDPAIEYVNAAQAGLVAASGGDKKPLGEAIEDIRAAADDIQKVSADAKLSDDLATQVKAFLDLSQDIRSEEAATLGPDAWSAQLRQLQASLNQLITTITAEQLQPEPGLDLLAQTLDGRFAVALQQSLAAPNVPAKATVESIFSELGAEAASIDRLSRAAVVDDETISVLRTAHGDRVRTVREGGLDIGGPEQFEAYDTLSTKLLDGVNDSISEKGTAARLDGIISGIVTWLSLILTMGFAFFVVRGLLDPINRVRQGARKVAHEDLPAAVAQIRAGREPAEMTPIDVDTDEEIGQLARAVDDLHAQARILATGEATLRSTVSEMFVTLSRRSNSLINQQLALIERLEQDEDDPKRLESLFRLDHLATRMRRTADSLLILADAPSSSTGEHGLSVSDAVQAASAGVQDYHRLQLSSHLSTFLASHAAGDVVHLITELLDNALSYSSPNDQVRVDASIDSSGAVLTIADAGIGIPTGERTALNQMLREGTDATPETARRMGLFVVSRLARRHNIGVELLRGDLGGTVARVVLPATILPELPQPAEPIVHRYEGDEPSFGSAPIADEPTVTEGGLPVRTRQPLAEPTAAAPVEAAAPQTNASDAPAAEPARTPAPPSSLLGGLLPRRSPGAQMPLTTPETIVPETPRSNLGGSLFSRATPNPPAPQAPAAEAPAVGEAEAEVEEKVADVVPISALAGVRAEAAEKAEAEARARGSLAGAFTRPGTPEATEDDAAAETLPHAEAEADTTVEEPESAYLSDPLSDPFADPMVDLYADPLTAPLPTLPPTTPRGAAPVVEETPAAEEVPAEAAVEDAPVEPAPADEAVAPAAETTSSWQRLAQSTALDDPLGTEPVTSVTEDAAPVEQASEDDLVDGAGSGLGSGLTLGSHAAAETPAPLVTEPVTEPVAEEPIAETPVVEEPVVEEPAVQAPEATAPAAESTEPESTDAEPAAAARTRAGALAGLAAALPRRKPGSHVGETATGTSGISSLGGSLNGSLGGSLAGTSLNGATAEPGVQVGPLSGRPIPASATATGPVGPLTGRPLTGDLAPATPSTPAPSALDSALTGTGSQLGSLARQSRSATDGSGATVRIPEGTDAFTGGLAAGEPSALSNALASLPSRRRGAAPQINSDMPGLPTAEETAAARNRARNSDDPTFQQMRTGWLSSDDKFRDFPVGEVDRGWQRAASVADQQAPVESTPAGLPKRQPGQRLVPGSVEQPVSAAPRDPEAIRSRLASHMAGVSRGRRTVNNQSSTQQTEAGPS